MNYTFNAQFKLFYGRDFNPSMRNLKMKIRSRVLLSLKEESTCPWYGVTLKNCSQPEIVIFRSMQYIVYYRNCPSFSGMLPYTTSQERTRSITPHCRMTRWYSEKKRVGVAVGPPYHSSYDSCESRENVAEEKRHSILSPKEASAFAY